MTDSTRPDGAPLNPDQNGDECPGCVAHPHVHHGHVLYLPDEAAGMKLLAGALGQHAHVSTVDITSAPTPDGGCAYTATAHRHGWWRRDVEATYTAHAEQRPIEGAMEALATLARILGIRIQLKFVEQP